MKITHYKETTIALFNDNDLLTGLDYKTIFDKVENSDYSESVDFYYNENGTVCFFKIFDTQAFLKIAKLDFTVKTYKLLTTFLTQQAFEKCSIIFYNYRG